MRIGVSMARNGGVAKDVWLYAGFISFLLRQYSPGFFKRGTVRVTALVMIDMTSHHNASIILRCFIGVSITTETSQGLRLSRI